MSQDDVWTIGRLLTWTTEYLEGQGADSPRLDAEILLAKARGCQRIDLYAAYDETASESIRTAFRELVRRRAEGMPVAYLVGRREFYSLHFEVTPEVLIPRPETELLVVALLDQVKKSHSGDSQIAIADIGTGSGVLAVCAAKHVPRSRVTAVDKSAAALEVARRNAARHGLGERITFVEGDLFDGVNEEDRFDYVLSNPPYVSTKEMAELPADVKDFEPHSALHGGEHGTEVIDRLIPQAAERLLPGGSLFIEVSPMIAERVEQIVRQCDGLEMNTTIRDLAGHARIAVGTKIGHNG